MTYDDHKEPLEGKGVTRCNRTACQIQFSEFRRRWYNTSTQAYYCRSCAVKINNYNPGLCLPEEAPCGDAEVISVTKS